MARTTLDIDPSVLQELRERGARDGKSLGQLASELLAAALAEPSGTPPAGGSGWVAKDMGTPLVDLEDKNAVQAILDAEP
jgi:hypothetical protein